MIQLTSSLSPHSRFFRAVLSKLDYWELCSPKMKRGLTPKSLPCQKQKSTHSTKRYNHSMIYRPALRIESNTSTKIINRSNRENGSKYKAGRVGEEEKKKTGGGT